MNPYHLPGDPSLPPGCTHADIDRAMGCDDDDGNICDWCGEPCKTGNMCKECSKQELADRRRDEEKDETR